MFFPVKMIISYPLYHAIERAVFNSRPFEKTWNAVRPKLENGVEIIAAEIHPRGPSLIRRYVYQEPALRRIIKECMTEMFHSDIMALLSQVRVIRKDIAKQQHNIVEWEKDLIAAPKKSWNPLDFSQSKLKGKINSAQSRIEKETKRIDTLINKSLFALHDRGVTISREQIDALLNTADGEDIASIMAVADTVKQIFSSLELQLSNTEPSSELSKTYAGFYMMCNRIYLEAIEQALVKIEKHYLKRIQKIRVGVISQIRMADSHLGKVSTTEAHKATLKNNIAINEKTLEAADFYTQYLNARAKDLLELRVKARQNYEVSLNTFLTMKMGSDLVNVIRKSLADLNAVFAFEPPRLSELYASGFTDQFQKLTNQIRNQK